MTSNTITVATTAVQTALDNQAAAIAKAQQTAMDADTAASHATELDRRLRAGDATVDIEAMIDAKASAERLALLAGAHNDALAGRESVIREARTAETVARLRAGAIRDREQLAAFVDAMAAKFADELESLVPGLEDERLAMTEISDGLPHTTAHHGGLYQSQQYRNGVQSSPIQIANDGDSYEVDGLTYATSLDVDYVLKRIVSELETVMVARKSARDLPAIMAGRAEQAAKAREQMELAQREREDSNLARF